MNAGYPTNDPWDEPSRPKYLLIQNNKIIDAADDPDGLIWLAANKQADILVAVGVVNEFGHREIAGIIAHYKYRPFCNRWLVSVDGAKPYETRVTGKPGYVLKSCLMDLLRQGKLNNLTNLSKVILDAA